MSPAALLQVLRHREIEVWAEGQQLRCKAPPGALDPALREELRRYKSDLVEFLANVKALAGQHAAIVPLQPKGTQTPIFAVPGHSGDVFCFRALARHLGDDQPFFGLQPPGLDGQRPPLDSVEALAAEFATAIRAFRPEGPCIVAGYCAGGTVAFELARQLESQGTAVGFAALFGSPHPAWYRLLPQLEVRLTDQAARLRKHARAFAALSWGDLRGYIGEKRQLRREKRDAGRRAAADPLMGFRAAVETATLAAVRRYVPQPFDGRVAVFLPNAGWRQPGNRLLRWPQPVARIVEEHCGPAACDGYSMLLEPHAPAFGELFRTAAGRAAARGPGPR